MTNATNANTMKEKNRRLIINLIRKNQVSRADISKATSLTKAAVSIIVDDLIKNGIVTEEKSQEKAVGRRPIYLTLNPDYMYALGINITRSGTEVGVVDITGNEICYDFIENMPKTDLINNIIERINNFDIDKEKILGIGVTAPGPVDSKNTTILNPPNFKEWHYENIGLRLKKAFKKDVYLENVSGGLALCEKYFGKAKDLNDFLVLYVTDGIGSGIISKGMLLKTASELGHTSICYNGTKCTCGNTGCLEIYASIPEILKTTAHKSWKAVIDSNDEKTIIAEAKYLACGITNAVNLFGFGHIFLAGDINYNPGKVIYEIEKNIMANTITQKTPEISPASDFSGVVCASTLVFDNWLTQYI